MSVELYPDHKAVLHFHHSLKVFEIDFLDYLTAYLTNARYANRHFDIYVKPTLHHSAFDFIIVEPHQAIYTIQTPETLVEYQKGQKTLDYFYKHQIHRLSPTLSENIRRSVQPDEMIKNALNTPLVYLYDESLVEEFSGEKAKDDVFITGKDFVENTDILEKTFSSRMHSNFKLTPKETYEIRQALNPNTNMKNYIPKSMPRDYYEKIKSKPQVKNKYKGFSGSGKSIVLAKRAINCSNRLKENGRILIISGNSQKTRQLKDLITGEAGKSLQELGMDVASYPELQPPKEKYQALFVDDAHYLQNEWLIDLVKNYLVPMTDENDYELVVMTDSEYLPTVPKVYGPFINLPYDLSKMTKMLNDSRRVFLDILENK